MAISLKSSLLSGVLVLSLLGSDKVTACPVGDINRDCKVNMQDLQDLAQQWLNPACAAPACNADLDGVAGVTISDIALLADHWMEQDRFTLVINELMTKNDGFFRDEYEGADDWIEIYNYGQDPIDIGGMYVTDTMGEPASYWRIADNAPDVTTVAAGGYIIIWADREMQQGPLHVDFRLSADGNEDVALYDAQQNLIDGISFGPLEGNESFGRLPDAGDTWQVFDNPTPRKANSVEPARIIINEIMYHPYHPVPGSEDVGQEYIELYNAGTRPVDMSGWQFVDGVDFTFPDGITLGVGQYLVVAADVNTFEAKYPDVNNVTGGWQGRLSNSSEEIELADADGIRISSVRYADQGDWAVRYLGPLDYDHRGWLWSDEHDGAGRSLELVNPELANEYGQNWAAGEDNDGTPGRVNSAADNDIAPLILDVEHFPVIPSPNEPVTVTARIVDEQTSGLDVRLYYRVDRSQYEGADVYPRYDPNDYNDVEMFDDGAHGDGAADDGLYGGEIPAHEDGLIIEFFVGAGDGSGNTRTWPAPSLIDSTAEQVTNALYQVDASFDLDESWLPGSQPVYYLIMTKGELDELSDIGDENYSGDIFMAEPMSNAQMNTTFISVDGVEIDVRYSTGVRNRGNRKRADPPMCYHVNFRRDRSWKGVTSLNFNSKYPHLEMMGSVLFQLSGLAAANARPVQIRVNGQNPAADDYGRTYGSYTAVEVLDSDFAKNHFPDDDNGNLYRCTYYDDGVHSRTYADLDYKEPQGQSPDPDDYRDNYPKQTNSAQDDYTDLFTLIDKLNNQDIPDSEFIAEVSQVLDLEKWTRFLAADALAGNREGGLTDGTGDDYAMYCGVEDPRFWLVPHDLDTMLGQGDHSYQPGRDIFLYAGVDGLERLLNQPDVIKLYYQQYRDLASTLFTGDNFEPLVDRLLGNWVPAGEIEGSSGIKQFVRERKDSIINGGYPDPGDEPQIPQEFTISSDLPVVNGYHHTTNNTASLSGTANAIDTRSVTVNGHLVAESDWSQRNGTWSIDSVSLNPGINRIIIQAFEGPAGTGDEVDRGFVDIWYDTGPETNTISGILDTNTTLDVTSRPWHVTGDLTVPTGVTLTIEPGTSVYFEQDVQMTINGRLLAQGTEYQRIRMTLQPGSAATSWNGLHFNNSTEDNRLAYVDMAYSSGDTSIRLDGSRLLTDNVTWEHTDNTILSISSSSVIVRNCVFPDTTAQAVSGHYALSSDPYIIFENNIFGVCSGTKQDVVDFSTSGPSPNPQFINNIFLGGGDDALDLDGTNAYIEGNIFMNFHRNFDPTEGESYAVTTGYDGEHSSSHVIAQNIFVNCDNAALVKDQSWIRFENNTVVDCNGAGINFDEPLEAGIDPGQGGYFAGNIFWNTPTPFAHFYVNDPQWGTTDITVHNSIVPAAWHGLGEGNIDADPLFVDEQNDFRLKTMSPAINSGPCGIDMGAYVPAGAAVCGEPDAITYRTSAEITVGGPGITHYKYALNDPNGSWSTELPTDTPIELTGLANGQSYRVYVIGKDAAGNWQSTPTASRAWTVNTSYSRLVINEVMAHTHGADPDLIELYYDGPGPIDLTDMTLTDEPANPSKFTFNSQSVSNTTMYPGEYMLLYGDLTQVQDHLGFALSADGEGLYLYDKNGGLIDSVQFGPQINDFTIGRIGYGSRWKLCRPTSGSANIAAALGDPYTLRINEWLANGQLLFEDDFIEIYNPHPAAVDVSGFYLTDNPVTQPDKQQIGPLSFIAGGGRSLTIIDPTAHPLIWSAASSWQAALPSPGS